MVFNDLILVGRVKSRSNDYSWTMPQGGMEEGETPIEAAKRELFEETGIRSEDVEWVDESDWYIVAVPPHMRKGSYLRKAHQKYKWFLALAKERPKIVLSPDEYTAYKWEEPERVISQTIPFKEEMYRNILYRFNLFNESMH